MSSQARIKKIDEKISILRSKLEEAENQFSFDENSSFESYQTMRFPFDSKINNLDRERRLLLIPTLEQEIPNYGHLMSLKEFIKDVKSGGFIDYDGYGYYSTETKMSNITIYPSDVDNNSLRKDFVYIVWFNR